MEHQIHTYKKVVWLGMLPLLWSVINAAPVNVSADDFTTTSQTTGDAGTSATATSPDSTQTAAAETSSTDSGATATPTATVDSNTTSDAAAPTSTTLASQPITADKGTTPQPTSQPAAVSSEAQATSTSTATSASTASSVASNQSSAARAAKSTTDPSTVSTDSISNPNRNVSIPITEDKVTELNTMLNQYLTKFNAANQADYQLLKSYRFTSSIENELIEPTTDVTDGNSLLANLRKLLTDFTNDNRIYLLKNYQGVDISFNLTTKNHTFTNYGKILTIPVYIVNTDEAGNQIGDPIPVNAADNAGLEYGGSWTTQSTDLAGYQLVSSPTSLSGKWDSSFDYGLLNDKGQLILKYVYKKTPVTPPVTPVTPITPVNPEPTPSQPITPNPQPTAPTTVDQQPAVIEPTTITPTVTNERQNNSPRLIEVPKTTFRPAKKLGKTRTKPASATMAPEAGIAVATAEKVTQSDPFTLIAKYTLPITVASPTLAPTQTTQAPQRSLKSKPQKARVKRITPVLDTNVPNPMKELAANLKLSELQQPNPAKITNPVLQPHQVVKQLPGGNPAHTQLGQFFAVLSGTINFGTANKDRSNWREPFS
ncbi:hypothetical protein KTE19_06195 [Lentilactobacillus sp. IMAU92037]|uniref:hypothetical protein n=1 Tax=Lentilactobacillus dabitei TaxID=2831523 RepID=UPI001C2BFE03|nr:hypothetical protein [Lentilactobacillus dabitei]MBV0930305.1 hypothetical protein [Lentilactobacillus dabitei]